MWIFGFVFCEANKDFVFRGVDFCVLGVRGVRCGFRRGFWRGFCVDFSASENAFVPEQKQAEISTQNSRQNSRPLAAHGFGRVGAGNSQTL